ncbi:UNVERIFIED_CONTAM: hypothetical protein Sradi_5270500 [Sesamum radiatum]|uniref:Uncharacterized protein n=1 Tax=Sesamum radiatum TaxID=300843 RepID=A0AAW2LLR5_SESRA
MPRSSRTGNLEFDPEIEKTAQRLRKETKQLKGEASILPEPETDLVLDVPTSSDSEEEVMAQNPERTIKEMTSLDLNQQPLCIEYPNLDVDFELKSGLIHLLPTFRGIAGLTEANRSLVDAASGGALYDKTPTEARKLITTMAANNQQFGARNDNPPKKVNEVSTSIDERLNELTSLVKKIVVGGSQQAQICGICTSPGHFTDACPTLHEEPTEHADAIGHPHEHSKLGIPNPCEHLKLESQMSQLASSVSRLESQGKLPSQTVINPKQNASAIVLRSGKELKSEVSTAWARTGKESKIQLRVGTQKQNRRFSCAWAREQGRPETELEIPSEQVDKPIKNGVVIQLADRSIVYPEGVLEDVLVQVNELVFPADFFVIDMREDNSPNSTSILLGRPFLKTARTKIDVHNGTLTMEFDGEVIRFNIYESMRYPSDVPTALFLDAIDPLVQEFSTYDSEDQIKMILERNLTSTQVKAPTLELKELPKHLKYAFLGENDTLPVIISSKLSTLEEEKLIRVLREFREAIGWTIADIKGLSPSTCMHRILLEEGANHHETPNVV